MDKNSDFPSILVVLGATGDLARKKIFPALYELHKKDLLPKPFQIVSFSRREMDDEKFRKYLSGIFPKEKHPNTFKTFLSLFTYQQGYFENYEDFKLLERRMGKVDEDLGVCSNKLFYLAVPPKYYKTIFKNISKSGLAESCSNEEGWTRILVEKPFGKDLKSARDLDKLLGSLFKEEQIYRIDHYLGKDMIQNILVFRFSNNIFEQSWVGKYIDKIEIKLLEKEGVTDRGTFYDGIGALRDVGQNHLLQMLSFVAMDAPLTFKAEEIRKKRVEILKTLTPVRKSKIDATTFRGQYDVYHKEDGVEKDSTTETYFKLKTSLQHPRWRGTEITLEAGKGMKEDKKEIVINFKHPTPCFCPVGSDHSYHNKVIISLEPEEEITFRMWNKKPGFGLDLEWRSFDLNYRKEGKKKKYIKEYEKLLLDCFIGDQTLFVSTDEVEAMWKFTDPIVESWNEDVVPLFMYKKGTDEVRSIANQKIGPIRENVLRKEILMYGLGKMGSNLALHLADNGWIVYGYNRSSERTKEYERMGIIGVYDVADIVRKLRHPRIVWVMVPSESTGEVIDTLSKVLEKGDTVIDGGNTFYEDSIKHNERLSKKGIDYVDVGVSGGPNGARYGASIMVGGNKKLYDYLIPLYHDISVPSGHSFFEGVGAGHFVKMVHNAIEYGMMQSLAEGIDLLKVSKYKIELEEAARIYNNGSVIEGKLTNWLYEVFKRFGEDLNGVSGKAGMGGSGANDYKKGEAEWAVEVAKRIGVPFEVIKRSYLARKKTHEIPSFQGRVINALRNSFGSHDVK